MSILAEVMSFPNWSEEEVMNYPKDVCHCCTRARDF